VKYEAPKVVKLAESVLVSIEEAVRRFPRYHKYAIGSDLRTCARGIALSANRAWRDIPNRSEWVRRLVFKVDDLKQCVQTAKTISAFRSFNEFEALWLSVSELGKQCGGWQKTLRSKGQNDQSSPTSDRRAQILSARAASSEANP